MPFIRPDDLRWQSLLALTSHDVYHLPGYCVIEAGLVQGDALAWYHETDDMKCLIPLISRNINGSSLYRDLVSPYGYPGLLCNQQLNSEIASGLFEIFHREASGQGYVSSFIRLNPLLNPWKLTGHEFFRQWFHGGTVSIDLQQPVEAILSGFSENHRRNLRKLATSGFLAAINDWRTIGDFIHAYRQTMNRRKADAYYFFPDSYFNNLQQLLADRIVYISITNSAGKFVAGGIFTCFGEVIQYHLGATSNEAVHQSPSKLMMEEAIRFGIGVGARTLHLGGGLGGSTSDGLFRFKKGFGNYFHRFSSLRFIHHPDIYNRLRKESQAVDSQTDYFPEYRHTR
ncbi:hypothetical protein MASR2M12_16820 [Bacteroidales bacterium]